MPKVAPLAPIAAVIAGLGCTAQLTGPPSGAAAGGSGAAAQVGSSNGGSAGTTSGVGGSAASTSAGGSTGTAAGGSSGTSGAGTSGTSGATGACTDTPAAVPFRVMTRLNRAEYANTARDLLGEPSQVVLDTLSPDSGDGGFDNNAAALTISPSLASDYEALALKLAANAMAPGSPGRAAVLGTCNPTTSGEATCASQVASKFAARAWRRPLQAGESDGLLAIYDQARAAGLSFDEGVEFMVEAALLSPYFLFRPELDPTPDEPATHPVDPYELASRLSYFVWSSMPDAALLDAAAQGALGTPSGVQAELDRLWADPKAEALFARFPGLWLNTQDITLSKAPAPDLFPEFDDALKSAMQTETALYMHDFMTGDLNFLDFINGKFTYLNSKLAAFYGIPGQFTDAFKRVDLAGNAERGGILTQSSVLTVTSMSERTSPVRRGQWVLARILASPPEPPPDMVPPLDATQVPENATMRQRMELHAAHDACAGCHRVMDPIGFGLENYDAIGAFRTMDNGSPVDASGTLDGGESFIGGVELAEHLRADPRVPTAVVQYVLSYALGRETAESDACTVAGLAASFSGEDNGRMAALVRRVALTETMLSRRGAP